MTFDKSLSDGPLGRLAHGAHGVLVFLNTWVERVFLTIATLLFATFICAIIYQVFARSILAWSVRWTDEVALMCFVWSIFMGAAVALRRGMHYVIDILPPVFVTSTNLLRLFGSLACLPLIYVLCTHGLTFANMGWRRDSIALELPLFYTFIAIPIAGSAMVLFALEVIIDDTRRLLRRGAAPQRLEDI